MPYSNIEQLMNQFDPEELARLTGDPSGQQINVVKVDFARVLAESIIDSYLVGRYDLAQIGMSDAVLTKLSLDLTIYQLFENHYGRTEIPHRIIWRRIHAIKLLNDLQAGRASLVSQYANELNPPSIVSNKSAAERTFGSDLLNQFSER